MSEITRRLDGIDGDGERGFAGRTAGDEAPWLREALQEGLGHDAITERLGSPVLEITAETAAMFHYRGHECWVAGIEAAHAARWAALLEEYAMVDLPAEHRGRLVLGAGKLAEAADVLERLDDALDELDTNIASMDAEPAPAGEGSALIDTRGGAMVWSKASALIVRSAGVIGAASFAEAPMGALVRWIDGGEGVFGAFYRDDETFVG